MLYNMTDMEESLKQLLQNIDAPNPYFEMEPSKSRGEIEQSLRDASYELLNILGYSTENTYTDVSLETPLSAQELSDFEAESLQFDTIVAETITSPPYLAINSEISSELAIDRYGAHIGLEYSTGNSLRAHSKTSRAKYTISLTNCYLAIWTRREILKLYPYEDLEEDGLEEICELIKPPDELPTGRNTHFPAAYHPNQTKLTRWLFSDSEITPEYRERTSTNYFEVDVNEYSEMLYSSYTANLSHEKGEIFEKTIEHLFEGLNMLTVRERRLKNEVWEIDMVLEYIGFEEVCLFDYQSRYVLVECKNTKDPVPAKEIGYFKTKLIESDVDFGIVVAWGGITGEDSNRNADRLVDLSGAEEPRVVVLTSRDLYRILDGACLYQILDDKLYNRRFNL